LCSTLRESQSSLLSIPSGCKQWGAASLHRSAESTDDEGAMGSGAAPGRVRPRPRPRPRARQSCQLPAAAPPRGLPAPPRPLPRRDVKRRFALQPQTVMKWMLAAAALAGRARRSWQTAICNAEPWRLKVPCCWVGCDAHSRCRARQAAPRFRLGWCQRRRRRARPPTPSVSGRLSCPKKELRVECSSGCGLPKIMRRRSCRATCGELILCPLRH
jgi:hypothetical protein